jgi:hypothetical protein
MPTAPFEPVLVIAIAVLCPSGQQQYSADTLRTSPPLYLFKRKIVLFSWFSTWFKKYFLAIDYFYVLITGRSVVYLFIYLL